MYFENHGIPRSIRLDQSKYLVGNQVKTRNKNNIEIFEALVNDHRAFGLVERLIQAIKNRLACITEGKLANNAFFVKHAIQIPFHQLQECKQKTTKISPSKAHFGRKNNTSLSVISTKLKLSNLSYENKNHYLDEDTVIPEEILPNEKWLNGYRSDIEVEIGMTRATRDESKRERKSTDGECRFLRSGVCRPIPLTEKAVTLKLAQKIHGKRLSKKNLEDLYEVLAPGSNIIKVSPRTSTIKEPSKTLFTVPDSDIVIFGTLQEGQKPLKVYADQRGPRTCKIHSHVKQVTRKLRADNKKKPQARTR